MRKRIKVERRSTFMFTSGLSYIVHFIYARKFYVRSHGKIKRQCRKSSLREGKGVPEKHLTFALA